MLSQVEVLSDQGTLLTLPIQDVSAGYYVKDITGLDPVAATIASSPFAQLDGEVYQASRMEKRNIVLTLGLESDYATRTIASMRKKLYEFFMSKARVTLRFVSEGLETVEIQGRVEDMDAPLFSQDPTATISIICHQPDFLSMVPTTVNGSTTSTTVDTNLVYPGSVDTGIDFQLNVNRAMSALAIYQSLPDNATRVFNISADMVAGDILRLSTVSGRKSATLTRGGAPVSAVSGISLQSNWIQLAPGNNGIRAYAVGAPVPFTLTYTTRYGGL